MEIRSIVILTVAEALDALYNWYADMIINDRQNVLDHLKEGKIGEICPNLNSFTPREIAERYAELEILPFGYTECKQVAIEIPSEFTYIVVWNAPKV